MPTKVLIVDDSVVIRRSLTDALARDPDLVVAGSAASGSIALMKIPLLQPDVVTLDIEMPEMDGVATLAAIRKAYPQLAVIMLSVSTDRGAAATMEALSLGARDYVMKPDPAGCSDKALFGLGEELAAKIVLCCSDRRSRDARAPAPPGDASPPPDAHGPPGRVDVLAIGVSTGGPNALMDLIPRFPRDFPVPILIVQHMPPMFTRLLAEQLAARSTIRVAEGSVHQTLLAGSAWIAPGDFHMAVERAGDEVRIQVHQDPPENSCRPAADVLFRSVARVYGPHVLAVVMTGMGRDGFSGCEHVRAAGGQVLVQDEATSVVWGMPGFVVRAGMADQILPLDLLGAEIVRRVSRHREQQPLALVTDGRATDALKSGSRRR
jgi:two-component system chemotaxis response regulator CheB